jgi:hypothetical protein
MPRFPHRVRFMGRVYPEGLKVTIKAQDITFSENTGMFKARFNVSVVDSVIEITCDFDNVLQDHPYSLWAQAQEITQTLVNLVAFNLGAGAITVLNRWINQTGSEVALAFADQRLPALCSAVNQATFDAVIRIVFAEPGLFMALNDIVLANAMPRHVLINCARCIETIRYLVAPPDIERGLAWTMMQKALNVDRAYLTFITQHSQEPRHGRQTEVGDPAILEVRARTRTIMDRFFHYRLGGNTPLSGAAFPLLAG